MIELSFIEPDSEHIKTIIALADKNSVTLGFLPKEVFYDSARKKELLIALDKKTNKLCGYILFAYNKSSYFVRITHFCLADNYKGKGISKKLFNHLKTHTKEYRGISLHCRRDSKYNHAIKLWTDLGFIYHGEKPGRGKDNTILTRWWFDHGHKTLFSQQENKAAFKIVLDTNIFIHLLEKTDIESQCLLNDWVQFEIDLHITPEILNEIYRNEEPIKRKESIKYANSFSKLNCSEKQFNNIFSQLDIYFPKTKNESNISDQKQLAYAISGGAEYFITKDNKDLLKHSESLKKEFGINVIPPSLLIAHFDELNRETAYRADSLAGAKMLIRKASQKDYKNLLNDIYDNSSGEKKNTFKKSLDMFFSNPTKYDIKIVENHEKNILAIIVYERSKTNCLNIPFFRINKLPLSKTVAKHLTLYSILVASSESRNSTYVSEKYISRDIEYALLNSNFMKNNNFYIKFNLPKQIKFNDLNKIIKELKKEYPEETLILNNIAQSISKITNSKKYLLKILEIERVLWPMKIIDLDIPCFIVPIKPAWAIDLFEENLARNNLFGANPLLTLNRENAYYRAKTPKILKPNARILWYITEDKKCCGEDKKLRACSYIDDVKIDRPKTLFKSLEHLGIYTWENIYKLAKKNINKDIMAFIFSDTELFNYPIPLNKLKQLLKKEGITPIFQAPIKIPYKVFIKLYNIGILGGIINK